MILRRFGAAIVLIAVLVASAPVYAAGGEPEQPNCFSVGWTNMVDTLRVIAYAGREIALGFETDQPGEGVGFVLYLAPSVCTGVGGLSGIQSNTAANPPPAEIPSYPALP